MNTNIDRSLAIIEHMSENLILEPIKTSTPHYLMRWHEFRDILRLAESNVSLNDAIEKVEMLYSLIRDSKN